jgi:hypothetical protein
MQFRLAVFFMQLEEKDTGRVDVFSPLPAFPATVPSMKRYSLLCIRRIRWELDELFLGMDKN